MTAAAVVTCLTVPLSTPAAAATPTTARAAANGSEVVCTSERTGLAAKLAKDIATALSGRHSTVALTLYDQPTKTTCALRQDKKYDSASIVKVIVLATLLQKAKQDNRYLTDREVSLAKAMITKSDNDATTALWKQLGVTQIKKFLASAGMTQIVPGSNGYWGLTQITARDQQKLLRILTSENTVLSKNSRAYALDLMNKVVSSQRWGTPAGAPSSAKIHVKNGWLPRSTHGWRVHSTAAFTGNGHDYGITVLTWDNSSMDAGVATIQAVAKAIHKAIPDPATTTSRTFTPPANPQEVVPPLP
jgi:beta-lactamase class A